MLSLTIFFVNFVRVEMIQDRTLIDCNVAAGTGLGQFG